MRKILLSILSLTLSITPLWADESQFGFRDSIEAGFRISIPFGPTQKSADKIKYGFQMALHRELNRATGYMKARQILKAEIVALNFSEKGFKTLSLAGQDIFIKRNGALEMVNFKESTGRYYGGLAVGVILGGAAVAGGIVLIVTSAD